MKFFALITLVLCSFSVRAQDNASQHYKIFNTAAGRPVTVDDIVEDMGKADVLFFGEQHNDSTLHHLELAILKKLLLKYPAKIALSMEMFESDCQPIVNEYMKGLIRESNFVKDARAWPNYRDYRPMVELAKTYGISLIAANAPGRYTNMVTRMGLAGLERLDAFGKSYLPPLPIDTAVGAYYQKFAAIMGGHASMPGMQLYQSQNLWDATMAWSIARYLKEHNGYKVLQINGGFHSEDKLGAAAQLKRYNAKVRVLNIATASGTDLNNPQWSAYSKLNDYIIVTDFKDTEQ